MSQQTQQRKFIRSAIERLWGIHQAFYREEERVDGIIMLLEDALDAMNTEVLWPLGETSE